MKPVILIVDDDVVLADLLKSSLAAAEFGVKWVKDANSAFAMLQKKEKIDLILLDYNLPGINGLGLLELVKKEPAMAHIPVIMLTVRGESAMKVRGLETGADDYVVKPVVIAELLSRIRAIFRRTRAPHSPEAANVLEARGIRIDPDQHEVKVDGKRVSLSPIEFKLLSAFLKRPGMLLTLSALCDLLSEKGREVTSGSLYVYMNSLRKKLGSKGELIESIRGMGYKLIPPD